ncbi:MAG TPA: hypothetical protein PLJ35_19620 [Anaerolineae bacterium]|nr:hypothetical protein [Anaerolineae bacterium]HOR01031.1 hypothetical protein [Anaerolineae bacterium]HPL29837.1 hypothetical protein [Anaerolineae bacterium]
MKCLVIMPFRSEFDLVYHVVRKATHEALPGEPIHCYWLKDVQAAGKITDDIVTGLQESALCIADVTGNNANVMWETGYAMALGKPTILIGQDVAALPFDLKVHRVLSYRVEALDDLAPRLSEAVRQTLARYAVQPAMLADSERKPASRFVAVTGTMRAAEAAVVRRIETLLQPYLAQDISWYCGSNGIADECALEYLARKKERAVAVGYHRYDLSSRIRALLEQKRIEFLDASVESVPRGLGGPSRRDELFAAKADLVVLFWDGQSTGIKRLLQYYQGMGKNLLIGYI